MNFSKLLAAGKSLIGMRNTHSPYRMRTANLLPKFESTKNPFAPAVKPDAVKAEAAKTETPVTTALPLKPVCAQETSLLFDEQFTPIEAVPVAVTTIPAAEPVKEIKPAPVEPVMTKVEAKVAPMPTPVVVKVQPAQPVKNIAVKGEMIVRSTRPPLWSEWLKSLNPISYLSGRELGMANRSKNGRTPVQAELSLEKVKVMRNDLSDADLEVISTRPAATSVAAAPKSIVAVKSEPTGFSRLTTKFFGVGQSHN